MISYEAAKQDSPFESDNKVDFGLCFHVEVTRLPRLAFESDLLLLLVEVLFHILVGTLKDDLALRLSILRDTTSVQSSR